MVPVSLDKQESVLVSGTFTEEDILALHSNPTLLSAKVSYIRSAVVELYSRGYKTFVFTSNGLFDEIVACVVGDFCRKGLGVTSVFVNSYPGMEHKGAHRPEELSHMSFCFSESMEDFDPVAFRRYLEQSVDLVLSPTRIKQRGGFMRPDVHSVNRRSFAPLN